MNYGRMLLLITLFGPTGCSYVYYGAQNLISGPYDVMQECAFRCRIRTEAQATWREICRQQGRGSSAAYARGFEDGFVDYVDAAGTGEPPAAAPIHLRRGLLHSDRGQADIEDWFAGFRHGVSVARASGLRERVVMPIALPARTPAEPWPAQVVVPTALAEPGVSVSRASGVQERAATPIEQPARAVTKPWPSQVAPPTAPVAPAMSAPPPMPATASAGPSCTSGPPLDAQPLSVEAPAPPGQPATNVPDRFRARFATPTETPAVLGGPK